MAINVTPIPRLTVLAAPAFTLGTANAAGDALSAVASNSTILTYDATDPAAVAAAAVVGRATTAARRDHVHTGTPATSPGVAKAWCYVASTGTLNAGSYNIASITDNGGGDRTVVIATDFADTNYNIVLSGEQSAATHYIYLSIAVGSFGFKTYNNAATPQINDRDGGITLFGEQ